MAKTDVIDLPDFEYTPQGFGELKAALKAGKTVRNPFARFYGEKIEVTVTQDTETKHLPENREHLGETAL